MIYFWKILGFSILCALTVCTVNAQPLEPVAGPKGLYGYRNSQTGELTIPHRYDAAFPFSANGFAYVVIDTVGSYIDKSGVPVSTNLPLIDSDFRDGMAMILVPAEKETKFGSADTIIEISSLSVAKKDFKYGFIDTAGHQVIAPIYDFAYPFSEGLAVVTDNGRHYYFNTKGEIVIDIDPKSCYPFSGQLAFVKSGDKWGCIDKTGKLIVDYRFNEVRPFFQGIAAVRWGDYWGYFTNKGEQLVACQYKLAGPFWGNRAFVQYDHFRGYVDRSGTLVIPMIYDFASVFSDGLACVQKNGKFGYIDTLGKVVIKLQYERASNFSDGLACVRKNGRYGFIDPSGKEVIKATYRDAGSFSNGLSCVSNGRKYGFIDVEGTLVIPMEYDKNSHFTTIGLAWVEKNGKQYFINKRGEAVKTSYPIFEVVSVRPKFRGGDEDSFSRWVGSQLKYPPELIGHLVEGRVLLSFVVDTDGSVTDIKVLQSVDPILESEAIRVISSSPKWTPGYINDQPIKIRYNFPVIFQPRSPYPVQNSQNSSGRQVR